MAEGVKREVEQIQGGKRKANIYNFLKTIYMIYLSFVQKLHNIIKWEYAHFKVLSINFSEEPKNTSFVKRSQ